MKGRPCGDHTLSNCFPPKAATQGHDIYLAHLEQLAGQHHEGGGGGPGRGSVLSCCPDQGAAHRHTHHPVLHRHTGWGWCPSLILEKVQLHVKHMQLLAWRTAPSAQAGLGK